MAQRILIAGAGIGGLAAALALAQRGCTVTVLEAAPEFVETGAGIQLGPNAMKVLQALGLQTQLEAVASFPHSIVVADVASGQQISRMLLGQAAQQRYGLAFATLHRADLHALLRTAASAAGVQLLASHSLSKYEQTSEEIQGLGQGFSYKSDVLIGADGLWSRVREQMLQDGPPRASGHAAFRILLSASAMPQQLRTPHVRLWWGKSVHVVSYPLRGQSLWNLVVLAHMPSSKVTSLQPSWSLQASHAQVLHCVGRAEPGLQSLLDAAAKAGDMGSDAQALTLGAAQGWKRWNLFDRPPLKAEKMACGRVALLGDAAHPMLPYLAQGAGMALEDAWVLAQCVAGSAQIETALMRYAHLRASRNAQVVRRARRNGQIFHLDGLLAKVRNAVLAWQGTQVVGLPWLYGQSVVERDQAVQLPRSLTGG